MELYLYDIDLSEKNIRYLLPFAEREAIGTDIWKEYVIRRLCEQKNVFSETCARFGFCGKDLESFAMADIEALWKTFDNKIVYHQTKQNKIDFAD